MVRTNNIDVNFLLALGNQTVDSQKRDEIKRIIIDRYIHDESIFDSFMKIYTKFLNSSGFKKEVMADLIIIYMASTSSIVNIYDDICKDIVNNASIEIIGRYGDTIAYEKLRELCISKFWQFAFQFENKDLHIRKGSRYLRRELINKLGKDDRK